jgi:NAD(P) transhydrogenase subunit alpha
MNQMMKIVVPKEIRAHESRVAASPETVKKFINLGFSVCVEPGAGLGSSIMDADYEKVGATIALGKELYDNAHLILKIQRPLLKEEGTDELSLYPKGSILVAHLSALSHPADLEAYAKAGISAVALECMPRITRAQSMDILSSQSNLAGYKAVLDAASAFGKAMPMMMTAAGTIMPARVLVIGAGVAGLQAIATARRLGAVVSAFDVRAAAKEQVESLGATFVEVESDVDAETAGGYAKEVSADYKARQAAKLKEVLETTDMVICTALIPGKTAPRIITKEMIAGMKPGSIIVDLAVEMGGNAEGSVYGEIVQKDGVTLLGHANVASRLARDASQLFARNVYNFIAAFFNPETKTLALDPSDEIIRATLVVHQDKVSSENK